MEEEDRDERKGKEEREGKKIEEGKGREKEKEYESTTMKKGKTERKMDWTVPRYWHFASPSPWTQRALNDEESLKDDALLEICSCPEPEVELFKLPVFGLT